MKTFKKLTSISLVLSLLIGFSLAFTGGLAAALPSTDYVYPGAASELSLPASGGVYWNAGTTDGILTEGGGIATAGLAPSVATLYLRASDFGFGGILPEDASVTGVEVVIGKVCGVPSSLQDNSVRLVNAEGIYTGADRAKIGVFWKDSISANPEDFDVSVYGGPDDLWGLDQASLSTMVRDSDFGVCLSVINMAATAYSFPYVDYMKIRIYYELTGPEIPELYIQNSNTEYNGLPQAAIVDSLVNGLVSDVQYNGLPDVPTAAGTYAITADFTPDDPSAYASLDDAPAGDFVILQGTPPLWLDTPFVVYNGSPAGSGISGDVPGELSDVRYNGDLTSPTNAGTYAVTVDFVPEDTVNYETLSDKFIGNFLILQAEPDVYMADSYVTYTGEPQSAFLQSTPPGTFSNVRYNGSTVVPTDVGDYAVIANFTPDDTVNYQTLIDVDMGVFSIVLPATDHWITLVADPPEGGTVSGDGIYSEGSRVMVSATANPGYEFTGWMDGSTLVSSKAAYRFIMGTEDRTLTATFREVGPSWPKESKLSVTSVGTDSVVLALSEPVPDAERYVVYFGDIYQMFFVDGMAEFTIDGLASGTLYKFTVQAVIDGVETTNGPTKRAHTK